MSRFLAYTLSIPGHLFPQMSTLAELRRRGHDAVVVTSAPALESIERAGVRARAATPELERGLNLPRAENPEERRRRRRALVNQQGKLAAADLERAIEAERPDVLLLDPLWGAMIAAEGSGLPWALAAHSPVLIPTLAPRASGPGYPPPGGVLGRLRDRLVGARQRRRLDARLPRVNTLRAVRGLEPLAHVWEGPLRAPLVLAYTAEPFEYPRSDWPASVRFVGPGSWDAPAEPLEWLADADGPPLVLVATSSVRQNDEVLAETALAALADQPFRVVATMPLEGLTGHIPSNARVERYVPHAAVLERAVCVVCHGGLGITQKALAAGVPVVAVPFGRDQFEVARRVEAAGAGVRLPNDRLTPARLREGVRRAMACRAGAKRVAAAFRAAGGAPAAADALEALAGGGGSRRGTPSRAGRPEPRLGVRDGARP
ncbi:MAG TPA: glycosyltransferase [Longimicrobiaceae bacterium]|nr:glycosyltransferase [Longimicrobiaceae bacterium]